MGGEILFISDDPNPYSAPSASRSNQPRREPPDLRLFLRWERLRLVYNAILGVETALGLVLAPPHAGGSTPQVIFSLAVLCFAANVCYCVGPVLDGYARLVGVRGRPVSYVFFGLGTAFAMLLTMFAVLSLNGPPFHD